MTSRVPSLCQPDLHPLTNPNPPIHLHSIPRHRPGAATTSSTACDHMHTFCAQHSLPLSISLTLQRPTSRRIVLRSLMTTRSTPSSTLRTTRILLYPRIAALVQSLLLGLLLLPVHRQTRIHTAAPCSTGQCRHHLALRSVHQHHKHVLLFYRALRISLGRHGTRLRTSSRTRLQSPLCHICLIRSRRL
jgi:hypothetical protein